MKRITGVVALMIGLCASISAAREWTDNTGRFRIEANLVRIQVDAVRLRKTDGEEIVVPFVRLSAADRTYLGKLSARTESTGPETNREALRRALAEKTEFEFIKTPLCDALEYLQDLHRVPILLDVRGLDDMAMNRDTPVTLSVKGLTLAEALDSLLARKDLGWGVRYDALFVTAAIEVDERYEPRVYRVIKPVDFDKLTGDMKKKVRPWSWANVAGAASIVVLPPHAIVVCQSQPGHREIERRFAEWLQPVEDVAIALPQLIFPRLQEKLEEPSRLEFSDAPLKDVVDFLQESHGVQIQLDQSSLDEIGLSCDVPVTFNVRGLSLRSALSLLSTHLELAWTVDQAEITITTPELACVQVLQVEHSVEGIVPSIDGTSLVDAIQWTVSPSSWDFVGGPGSIRLGADGKLVVNQVFGMHWAIAEVLEALRQTQK